MKAYKYYAIRVGSSIVFKRTLVGLKKVQSVLMKKNGTVLKQVSYTGGMYVGSMSYSVFAEKLRIAIAMNGCKQIDSVMFESLKPFMFGAK